MTQIVICHLLDASKVFDRVEYVKLQGAKNLRNKKVQHNNPNI